METQDDLIARLSGDELIEEGATELALEEQETHGGRLSSHLLAMGFLDEPDLVRVQAELFAMEPAPYHEGVVLDTGLIALLGPEFVRRHQVVPIATDKLPILFSCAPLDISVRQTIESKMGMSARIYWWPELRLLQALHNALGDRLPYWATGFFKENPVTMTLSGKHTTADIQEALRSSRSLGSHWTIEELHDFFTHCFDRDTLLKVLLGYAGNWLSKRMVAVISKAGLQPYFVEDWIGLDPRFDDLKELRKLSIPDTLTTTLLSNQAGFALGSPADLGLEGLFEAMNAAPPVIVVAVPVCIGPRTAMLLTGVPTSRVRAVQLEEVSESFDTSLLQEAATAVGAQLEELIKRAKSGSLPPRDERIPPLPQRLIESLSAPPEPVFEAPREEAAFEPADAFDLPPMIGARGVHQTQQLWAIDDPLGADEDSAPGQLLPEEVDPRQTQRIEMFSAISEASAPEASVEEHLDPMRTSSGMPALTIEDLSPDDLEPPCAQIQSEVDEGWDDLLDQAEVSEPARSQPVDQPAFEQAPRGEPEQIEEKENGDEDLFPPRPTSTRDTLIGGFSVETEGRGDRPTGSETMRMPAFPHVEPLPAVGTAEPAPEPASEPAPERDEKQEPQAAAPQAAAPQAAAPQAAHIKRVRHDSSAYLPGAQIFKRSTLGKKTSIPADPAEERAPAAFSTGTPSEGVSPQTLPLGAVVTPASSADKISPAPKELLEPDIDPLSSEAQRAGDVLLDAVERPEPSPAPDPHAWLDEWSEAAQEEEKPRPVESMTVNTMQLGLGTKTQSFGKLMQEMAGDGLHHNDMPGPLTIPPEALEELLDSGPIAIELEQSLAMLDSSDILKARAAAEHLATAGVKALDALESIFPGRLFIDRYQYTPQTLPPVAEHGAVLDALVRIGEPSVTVVREFLDHQSLELRFYATFLLTELPAQNLMDQLYPRLFDRDLQTRYLAQKVVSHQRHILDFDAKVLARLRQELIDNEEEVRVEVAADMLRAHKDVFAVAPLIDALSQHQGRVLTRLHEALRQITFQSFSPSISEWRNWWYDAYEEPRTKWLIDALNSADEGIRFLAFDEVQNIPGLELKYHPEQPVKLRLRAQGELRAFFDASS